MRTIVGLAMMSGASAVAGAAPLVVTPRGSQTLAVSTAIDQHGRPFTITGMSGIVHRGDGRFAAVMDNSSRVVFIDVVVNANGSIASTTVVGGLTLSHARDHEGVCVGPSCEGSLLISDETSGAPASPSLHEHDAATGAFVRTIAAPAPFENARANFGFESLTRSPAGGVLWSANEEALTSDGGISTSGSGTVVRLLQWRLHGQAIEPARQYAYVTLPIHGGLTSGARSGVSDLVSLPDGRLLALERSLAATFPPFQSRIYEVGLAGATNVSGMPGLVGQTYTPVRKTLLWSGSANNLEGLCLGRPLASGNWSLIGIVDDADPLSQNTVVAFELSGVGAAPEDVNADGELRVDDAYAWSLAPTDVNLDGAVDASDADVVRRAARVAEVCDVVAPDR